MGESSKIWLHLYPIPEKMQWKFGGHANCSIYCGSHEINWAAPVLSMYFILYKSYLSKNDRLTCTSKAFLEILSMSKNSNLFAGVWKCSFETNFVFFSNGDHGTKGKFKENGINSHFHTSFKNRI